MRNLLVGLLVSLWFAGCASNSGYVTPSEEGAQVTIMNGDPPPECTEVGNVNAYSLGANYQDRLKDNLKKKAAQKGGNFVRLEVLSPDGNAAGTAFRCPIAATSAESTMTVR